MRVDTLYRNGTVLTMDPQQPRADAIAVWRDRIVAVGSAVALRATFRASRTIDLTGRTLVPGFNDAHNHMVAFGLSLDEVSLRWPSVTQLRDIYDRIASRARETPRGAWVVASGYDQNKLLERRHPDRDGLDRVAPHHLVWLKHASGHMSVVNGRVLEAMDLERVPVPAGGAVERDARGRPTGLLLEQAQALVRSLVYPCSVRTLVTAIERASERYLREGVTSCQEAGIGGGGLVAASPLEAAAYQEARLKGRLSVRVTLMVAAEALHEVRPLHRDDSTGVTLDLGLHTGLGDEWLRLGPVKVFSDGSLIGRTAAMFEDFANDPGNRGFFQTEPARLREVITGAHRSGWQVATHAIGDRAVATVLDIYEEMLQRYPRANHRHRIEHCAVIDEAGLDRMQRLGVIPVPQGRFASEIGDGMKAALGPERTRQCYRQRSFLDRGIVLPGSSDRPVVAGAPLLGIHDLVNQRTASGDPFNPEEALTPLEALRAFTLGSAYAAFEDGRKGSLEVGKLADFAILSADPTAVDPAAIAEIQVDGTVVGGRLVYDRVSLGG
jgi:predicted amidohydrolase YtcJ